MLLPITLTCAAAAAIGNIVLAMRIVRIRLKDRILLGDGDHPLLLAPTRAQANYVEYVPFALILIGSIEAGGGGARWLGIVGGVLAAARIAHAIGMDRQTANAWRAAGAMATWAILLGLALWGLVLAYGYDVPSAMPVLVVDAPPTA